MQKKLIAFLISLPILCALLLFWTRPIEQSPAVIAPLSQIENSMHAQETILRRITNRDDIVEIYNFDGMKSRLSDTETLSKEMKKAQAALEERYLSYEKLYEEKHGIERIILGSLESIMLPCSIRVSPIYHNESTVAIKTDDDLTMSKEALDHALVDQAIVEADYAFPKEKLSLSIESGSFGWFEFIPIGDEEFGMVVNHKDHAYETYSHYSSDRVTGYMLFLTSKTLPQDKAYAK